MKSRLDSFKSHWLRELDEWKDQGLTGEEQKNAQRFWIDLFECFGVSAARMNLFERNARRGSTGGSGRIDLFYPGVVIGEAKKPGVDLEVAYKQALDYLNGGDISEAEWPRYILCSNFERIRVTRLGDPEDSFDAEFGLAEVADHLDQLKFLAGYDTVTKREEARASIHASKLMADLFTAMAGDDVDEPVGDETPTSWHDEELRVHESSMYLTRLLFLLFGDDAGLWEADLFTRFVEEETTASNLGAQLNALFEVLNTPENKRRHVPESMARFPYVNGAIFAEMMRTQYFNEDMRNALLAACRFNWAEISPAIFGSLFQLVKSKEARRADGEHYTSEDNILKVLEPLFLDEVRAEASRLIRNKSTTIKALKEFRDSLADHVFLDPACGSGNFLIVAYRELRRVETDLIEEIWRREGMLGSLAVDVSIEQRLSIDQFYGFEIGWWPARIAETAMFLVDHQANKELAERIGQAPYRLPIEITAHIIHSNALTLDWNLAIPEVSGRTYVFGNPPFIGQGEKSPAQAEEMKAVWGKDHAGYLDYVTAWHKKAMELLEDRDGEFAFVATNSITQGIQVSLLFGPIFNSGWNIKFAHRTFEWDSQAPGQAAVHCVIIGFTREGSPKQRFWDYETPRAKPVEKQIKEEINAYLIDGPNVLVRRHSKPLSPVVSPAFKGTQPTEGGHLIVEPGEELDEVMADPIAAKYLREFRGSRELIRGLDRYCLWLEDATPSEIQSSPVLRSRVEAVRQYREAASPSGDAYKLRQTPHLFRGNKNRPTTDYLCIPSVASEGRDFCTVAWLSGDTIASNLVYTAEDPEGLQFALISSGMFIAWQKAVGGRLESRIRFANTLTWNTFPAPELSNSSRERIIKAGKKVLAARELHPERSLKDHYNRLAMDPALLKAHNDLDREVDKAFGASKKLSTEVQRLELLFRHYRELTEAEEKK